MDRSTLVSALRTLPRNESRGFRFVGLDRKERYYSYQAMEAEANHRAAHLARLGIKKGDRLALLISEPHEFVLSFFGASVAGAVPVPIFPRASFKNIEGYLDTLDHILRAAEARLVICTEQNASVVEQLRERNIPDLAIVRTPDVFAGEPPPFEPPAISPDDLCFLQFTSGSTSKPKGVMVRHSNLVANSGAFLGPRGLNIGQEDVALSWLPLYHDMGLIGFVLGTLIWDLPAVILPTELFARQPRLWLELITTHRATITYAPNFAYDLLVKRTKDKDLESLDLSRLRVAGCGAEPIRARTLQAFADRFAPAGFRDTSFVPSYGMAESTLAISFHQLGTKLIVDRVSTAAMKTNLATPTASATAEDVIEFVSCGEKFPGHDLRIVDEHANDRGEREVGEIIIRGPSVTDGYYKNEAATKESWRNGWLHTGDLGYIASGNVYICGRAKDLIIIRGANHYPQDIEWVVGDIEGVRRGNVFAFSVMRDGVERLIIAAECNSTDAARLREEIAKTVQQEFGLVPDHVALLRVGSLPKTSSGKAQRRKTQALFEAHELQEHEL